MAQRIFSSSDFQSPPARGARSRGGSVASRLISALVGLVVTAPALLLVMVGGTRAYSETLVQAKSEPAIGAVLLAVAGLVLLVVVVLSGLLSAAGPFVAGLVATGAAIGFLVAPGSMVSTTQALTGLGADSVTLVTLWCRSGLLLVVGVTLLASALARIIAARSRSTRGRGARTLVSIIVALVATAGGVALVVVGSAALLRTATTPDGDGALDVPSLLILLAGAVVLSGVVLTSAWSSAGTAIMGALLLLLGLAGFLPAVVLWVFRTLTPLSSEVSGGASTVVAVGFVAVVGVVLIGAAASAARARRAGR
jgi:hypothetical protein